MDIKSEIKESVEESKRAKWTRDSWISNARSKASSHNIRKNLWLIFIIVLFLSIGGLYIELLYPITEWVYELYGKVNMEGYFLFINVSFIILGIILIIVHVNKKNTYNAYADELARMNLTHFRRTYM